jgi:cytochrome c-type biogenesis protein CcmF
MYPLMYEFIYDQKISVGAPFYNAIFVPITILACLFLFFSIESKWQSKLKISFLNNPLIISLLISLFITFLSLKFYSVSNAWTLVSLFAGSLIISRYILVIYAYLFKRKFVNIYSVLAHLGLGLLIISIALNNDFSSERALNIKINETETYNNHEITFNNLQLIEGPNYESVKADFTIENKTGSIFLLNPEKRKYFVRGQITTETAIHASFLKDIYLTIGDQLDDGSWIVNVQFNYFIRWIWFSATLMIISGLFLARSLNRVHS